MRPWKSPWFSAAFFRRGYVASRFERSFTRRLNPLRVSPRHSSRSKKNNRDSLFHPDCRSYRVLSTPLRRRFFHFFQFSNCQRGKSRVERDESACYPFPVKDFKAIHYRCLRTFIRVVSNRQRQFYFCHSKGGQCCVFAKLTPPTRRLFTQLCPKVSEN